MGELILLNTAFRDVKIAFFDNGSGTGMDYFWMEKNGIFQGVSWIGYRYLQKKQLEKEIGPLRIGDIEAIAKEQIVKTFSKIILVGDKLNMDEVQSVLSEKDMNEIAKELYSSRKDRHLSSNYLSLNMLLQEYLLQNKGDFFGVRRLIFQAASVKNLFSTENEERPEIGLNRNIMAAMITDENSAPVIQQECIQLLKNRTLMEAIYSSSMVLDDVIQKRDDKTWWVNIAGGMMFAVRGKSSVKMYIKGSDQPIEIRGLSETTLGSNPREYFTPKGLACFYSQLKISKSLLALNVLDDGIFLPYKKIDRLEYRKKVIWKNPI